MCRDEGVNLQRGMNYRIRCSSSVLLMSVRPGAPYADRVEEDGRVLIYEGHNQRFTRGGPNPKTVDQPFRTLVGSLTENGKFYEAARRCRDGDGPPERVRVYEKMRTGIWSITARSSYSTLGPSKSTVARLQVSPRYRPRRRSCRHLGTRTRAESDSYSREARGMEARPQAMREMRQHREPPLRPRDPVLARRIVPRRREHSTPLRATQPRKAHRIECRACAPIQLVSALVGRVFYKIELERPIV
jgi:hypothetical protein